MYQLVSVIWVERYLENLIHIIIQNKSSYPIQDGEGGKKPLPLPVRLLVLNLLPQ